MIDTSLNSFNFYFLLVVFQGIVLSLLIMLSRSKEKANIYFATLIFLFSISLLHSILEFSIHAFNSNFPIPMDFSLSYGPLAYLHLLHIKDPMRKFKLKDLLHFLPSLMLDVLLFTAIFLYLGANMEWAYANIALIQTFALCMSLLGIMQFSIYTYYIYRESKDTQQVLKEFAVVKNWLSTLVISWLLVIGFLMVVIPISLIFIDQLDDNSEWLYYSVGSVISLWIFVIGYLYLLRYAQVIENYINRVRNFQFSKGELHEKKKKLLEALERQKIYKDPKMTIAILAGHLGWPINNVSVLINETFQTNFNDLINQYRINEFKQRCTEPQSQRYSILGLGQEAGFSSKASFYRIFKKKVGMTPTEFINSQ